MKAKSILALLVLMVSAAHSGCGGSSGTSGTPAADCVAGTIDLTLVGEWRILSEAAYFDNGQHTDTDNPVVPVTTTLTLSSSGWEFGSSSGTWGVANIASADWTTWEVNSDGYYYQPTPTRKLTLCGWSDGTGSGPIDENGATIDNIWAIYGYTSDLNGPGTVYIKFWRQ